MASGSLLEKRVASHPLQTHVSRPSADPVRVLLVDDSPPVLDALAAFLMESTGMDVVETVTSGEYALERTRKLQPDLVLMDLSMPGMGGLEATRRIKTWRDAPRVVALSLHDHPAYRDAARTAGCDGFVSKSEIGDQLMPVIENLFPDRIPVPALDRASLHENNA